MQFQFDSFQAFINMGGHGFYVWLCYAFVFLLWGYLAFSPKWETKSFFKQEQKRAARRAALEEEGK